MAANRIGDRAAFFSPRTTTSYALFFRAQRQAVRFFDDPERAGADSIGGSVRPLLQTVRVLSGCHGSLYAGDRGPQWVVRDTYRRPQANSGCGAAWKEK